jgi:dipeptidyl aminopeptidase/acylaminoacyl peptidase
MSYEDILTQPRLTSLRMSPDGSRAVVDRAAVEPGAPHFAASLVEVRTDGAAGERTIAIGDGPGDAERVAAFPNPIAGLRAARGAPAIAFGSRLHAGASTVGEDAEKERLRREQQVTAALYEEPPVRFWDHYAGPRVRHVFSLFLGDAEAVNLTPGVGPRLEAMGFDIAPDGASVVCALRRAGRPMRFSDLVVFTPGGEPAPLNNDDAWHDAPEFSPDGRWVACLRREVGDPRRPSRQDVWLIELATGRGRALTTDLPTWPFGLAWSQDSRAVYFAAPLHGREAILHVELDAGEARPFAVDGGFNDLRAPAGGGLFALRSRFEEPHGIVRVEEGGASCTAVWPARDSPRPRPERVSREAARAGDGEAVPFWQLLPPSADPGSPAPLVVLCNAFVPHAWSDRWYFRWNPLSYVAEGYAVIMPDVSPSLGVRAGYVERGWGRWADVATGDLLAAVDAAAGHPAIDGARVALVGGGWGGWLAAFSACHSDRFAAIVTQGAAWNLESYQATTDEYDRWDEQLGDRRADAENHRRHSPSSAAERLTTPALVFTGDRDFRAPADDSIAMFRDLTALGHDVRLVFMHGEGHRIGTLASERVWYRTIFAFLAHHLRGEPWVKPPVL